MRSSDDSTADAGSLEDETGSRPAAERENRFKEEFLGTLSHELRTPLHAVFGWARTLEDQRLDASQSRRAIEAIGRNARAMARIVDELLDVARISAGKLHLTMEPINAAAAIRVSVDAVASTAAAKGVDLYFSSRLAGERVNADPGRLRQVLWNLLTNAIKFTPRSGRVDVHLAQVNQQVEVRVSDTGDGIAPEFLPHVFERFRQGNRGPAGDPQGLGLGLAIARHLVELHGGTLSAESGGEGRGARRDVHHQVAGPGRDAPTRADVLVTALGPPDQDGCALLRELRARDVGTGSRLPAVVVTGHARVDDLARVLDAGFDAHLLKPVDPADLTSAVVAALSSRTGTA